MMLRPKDSGKQEGGGELLHMSALASLSNDSSAGNVDPRLIDELHGLLPLLESLLDRDRKVSSCFTRKGKVVYTKTPSKESVFMKKGRHTSQSIPTRECSILGGSDRNEDCGTDNSSNISQRAVEAEKDGEEINALKNQLEALRQQLSEKEELLSAAELSSIELKSAQEELKELKCQMREKDLALNAFERQVSDAKVKLAETRAALEKIQWEAMKSKDQVKKLQEDQAITEPEMSAFIILVEGLMKDAVAYTEYEIIQHQLNYASVIDDMDDLDLPKMEEAREVYLAAVAAAKESQDEESLAAAASARFHLQSFVLPV